MQWTIARDGIICGNVEKSFRQITDIVIWLDRRRRAHLIAGTGRKIFYTSATFGQLGTFSDRQHFLHLPDIKPAMTTATCNSHGIGKNMTNTGQVLPQTCLSNFGQMLAQFWPDTLADKQDHGIWHLMSSAGPKLVGSEHFICIWLINLCNVSPCFPRH